MNARKGARASALALAAAYVVASSSPALGAAETAGSSTFSSEQIEQLVAPIALYPDPLVAQVLMASTYPLEVVAAARWVKANPGLTGDALEKALEAQSWDASVKSLTAFPQVLDMMDGKLDWTTSLGDAFLAQQSDVLAAVQTLRARAKDEGNLESNEQQKVVVQQAQAAGQPQTIVIEPASPQVVYVPTYNPTVVYGAWPYPAYPPYSYYPPGYVASSVISFGVGLAVGSALWGNCNWGGGDVDIDVNRYNEFNRTDIKNGNWNHDVSHRKGVQYRDQGTRERYGRTDQAGAKSRESFRGRAEQGQREIAGGGADRMRQQQASADRARTDRGSSARSGTDRGSSARSSQRSGTERRPSGAAAQREARSGSGGRSAGYRQASAFSGTGSGAQVRQQSQRGYSSRSSASASRGAGGGRSGGRSGGGGRGRR